jgi:pimeloyl-ACP methyl ester carboxylesterase
MSRHGGPVAVQVSDGAFLRFLEIPGEDPPVVWIHGWQCSSTGELLPAAVQPALAGRRSLLVDLLGHTGTATSPTASPTRTSTTPEQWSR